MKKTTVNGKIACKPQYLGPKLSGAAHLSSNLCFNPPFYLREVCQIDKEAFQEMFRILADAPLRHVLIEEPARGILHVSSVGLEFRVHRKHMHSKSNWNVSEAHVQELLITSDGDFVLDFDFAQCGSKR